MALFEPSCGEAYADVFSDATDTDFCVLGYEGRKLKCDAKGVGDDYHYIGRHTVIDNI